MESEKKLEEKQISSWTPLLPPKQNDYQGYSASLVFLFIVGCTQIFRSIVHTFFPDGGTEIIAGFNLDAMGSVDMVLWSWAWSGTFQILYCIVLWMILLRYRKFVPMMYSLLILENLLLRLVSVIKPLTETLPEHTPPGAIGYALMLPLLIIFFILSMRKSNKK